MQNSELVEMLRRKQELDQQNRLANNMADSSHWVADALELLLRLELERRKHS